MTKVAKSDAVEHSRDGVYGRYYQLPDINSGTTVAYAEFRGEHGQRTIGDRLRIYYILDGQAEFEINLPDGRQVEKFVAEKDDTVAIPAGGTYNLFPKTDVVKVLLIMELLDVAALPK